MNREDVAMDLTFENLDLLRKEVHAAKLLLSECDKVLEEDGGVYIELRAFLSGKMDADDVIALLASQQGEQVKHPEQADGAQGDACAWLESLEGDAWADACEEIAASVKKMRQQADDEKVEREAFEAHESKERRLSPTDQQFWFRRGAIADYDLKSIDDAWKAWKARAALAQPALQCKKCGGTGDADSGGIHPWGEAAMVPCDCAHTERAQGKRTEDGDTIIDRLRLGGLTIDGDNAYKRDLLDCVVGALAFGFQGRPAHEETHWLHRFWEIGNAEREALAALAQPSPAPELERPEVVTHSDDAAVDRFSASMKQKLEAARAKGRSGWDDPSSCDVAFLAERLIEHLGKGNAGTFEDVANFAMMLHQRGAHPQVLAEAAGAIERDYLRIIQAQEEKWSGRFEVLEDEAKTLRRERDAAQARVAELEKQEPAYWLAAGIFCFPEKKEAEEHAAHVLGSNKPAIPLYTNPVAQAGKVPKHKFDGLVEEVQLKDSIIAQLRERVANLQAYRDGDSYGGTGVWAWAGDGEDHLESLACPIVISANDLRALIAQAGQVPEGYMVLQTASLSHVLGLVEGAMEDAYGNAFQVCCGKGSGGECCGDPEAGWSPEDQRTMDVLNPIQRELRAMLAAAPAQGGE
ncbi:hypothetical protein [Pseudomonas nitroreducens]|uniref:Uncharacterized protein n=1 Tax=Pseudomonas nitroreducens TaxID=46680 RepID=A0A6G6INU9_PSENT|nr:hypothetical protein [Pseudomonas nitroreducens]QIE84729.1 hypothetical protein G5B91_10810 [Pseudomonas nitroreducens]